MFSLAAALFQTQAVAAGWLGYEQAKVGYVLADLAAALAAFSKVRKHPARSV